MKYLLRYKTSPKLFIKDFLKDGYPIPTLDISKAVCYTSEDDLLHDLMNMDNDPKSGRDSTMFDIVELE